MVDYFENTAGVKVSCEVKISGNVLHDLGERTIATESILFVHDHLKYIKSRAKVKLRNIFEIFVLGDNLLEKEIYIYIYIDIIIK